MNKPRISYVDPSTLTDPAMLAELDRCRREGTPRPESQAVRAHVPPVFWSFANSWNDVFRNGVAEMGPASGLVARSRSVARCWVSSASIRASMI